MNVTFRALITLLICSQIACTQVALPDPPSAADPAGAQGAALDTALDAPVEETGTEGDTSPAVDTDDATDVEFTVGDDDAWIPALERPNVLTIVLDTQRSDAVTANIDRLPSWFMERGVSYSRLLPPSSHTPESAPWMLSGCDVRDGSSQETGAGDGPPRPVVPAGCVTMAERFADQDYTTLLSSGNYAFVNEQWYPADIVAQIQTSALDWDAHLLDALSGVDAARPWSMVFWGQGARLPINSQGSAANECDTELHGVDLNSVDDIHDLQDGGVAELTATQLDDLAEAMACNYEVDTRNVLDGVARMLEAARAAGHLDNTVVVLTSDHGENLLDYRDYPEGYAPSTEWVGHGQKLHLYEVASFAHVWYPDAGSEVTTVDRFSGSADLLQLVYHLSGMHPDGVRGALPWDAVDAVFQGKLDGDLHTLAVAYDHPETGEAWRYLIPRESGGERLFNQTLDPEERVDRLASGARPPQDILNQLDALLATLK